MRSRVWVLCLAFILLPSVAVAQTVTVDPSVNRFAWSQPTPPPDGSGTPDSFSFTCGAIVRGGFPYVVGQTVYETLINTVVSAPGTYACNIRAVNAAGSSPPSNTVSILIPQSYQLAVSKTGQGTVTSVPAGITCGAVCNFSFGQGASVTLTAAPAAGYLFKAWTGDCVGTAPTCLVTMTGARTVTAGFVGVPLVPGTLTVK